MGIYNILTLPESFRLRNIHPKAEGFRFSIRWASGLVGYFQKEPSAASVTYEVSILLSGAGWHDGTVEIRRDGTHAIRLAH